MGKLISFMHVSLDGFVAGPKGEMDWIHVDEEIFDHGAKRITATDYALYGRNTFLMMEGYWPTAASQPDASRHDIEHSSWYAGITKVVLSTTLDGSQHKNTRVIRSDLASAIHKLKLETDKEILVFGSPTATHSLMAADLIDGYWLFVNPVLLGQGIPLFEHSLPRTSLTLVNSHTFPSGVVCLNYRR